MALPSKFYISDLHLGHKNILAFDNRPFFSLEEMTETIISNWNSVVSKNDSVYVLGDMFWNNAEIPIVLPRLNGVKYLIKGNHDRINKEMENTSSGLKIMLLSRTAKNTLCFAITL